MTQTKLIGTKLQKRTKIIKKAKKAKVKKTKADTCDKCNTVTWYVHEWNGVMCPKCKGCGACCGIKTECVVCHTCGK